MHSSTNALASLFARGCHLGVACWLLAQKLRVVSLSSAARTSAGCSSGGSGTPRSESRSSRS
eukprot:9281723-Alexandrium_andersonii.AAC.1